MKADGELVEKIQRYTGLTEEECGVVGEWIYAGRGGKDKPIMRWLDCLLQINWSASVG